MEFLVWPKIYKNGDVIKDLYCSQPPGADQDLSAPLLVNPELFLYTVHVHATLQTMS